MVTAQATKIDTTFIPVVGNSNWEALENSGKLKYLSKYTVDYTECKRWQAVDSTNVSGRLLKITKYKSCEVSPQNQVDRNTCKIIEQSTVNIYKKKVVRWNHMGPDYSAVVEFTYNRKGQLVKYTEDSLPSKLYYGDHGDVTKVEQFKLHRGEPYLIGVIIF